MLKRVLLTGVTGYVGLHCALELITNGYQIRGTLRNMEKSNVVLDTLSGYVDTQGKIEFLALDLLSDEGWDEAMDECDFVMHIASPYFQKVPKDENILIRPAVEGTTRVFKAAHKADVKRVVMTSSMVTMMGKLAGDEYINDQCWTEIDTPNLTPYFKSKTLAELSAWAFAKEHEVDMVTVHPDPIFGPPLGKNISGESMFLIS